MRTGVSSTEMKDIAEKLRNRETDLDFEWKSDKDKDRYADMLDKLADLWEVCPNLQGVFSLEPCLDKKDNLRKHSPLIVLTNIECVFKNSISKEEKEDVVYSRELDLLMKQVSSSKSASKMGVGKVMAFMADAYYNTLDPKEAKKFVIEYIEGRPDFLAGFMEMTERGEEELRKHSDVSGIVEDICALVANDSKVAEVLMKACGRALAKRDGK